MLFRSVEKAREVVEGAPDGVTHYFNGDYGLTDLDDLEQAIADYEQLFGNTETLELETLRDCDTSPHCKKFDERVE